MTGSNFFSPSVNLSFTAIALKTSLKSVFSFFNSLSRLFQLAYFVKCLRTVEAVQWAPTARKCKKKKKFIKKGDSWANSGLPSVLSVLFTPRGGMISLMKSSFPSTVFCVDIWLYFSLNGCRAWHRNLRLMIDKWTFDSEISKDDQKRIKCVYLGILFQIYTGFLST